MSADRHAAEIEAIRTDVLSARVVTEPGARALAMAGGAPEALREYLSKVRHSSYRVVDDDIAALRGAGISEDAIYELTVAACVGIAYERLQAAKRAMQAATA